MIMSVLHKPILSLAGRALLNLSIKQIRPTNHLRNGTQAIRVQPVRSKSSPSQSSPSERMDTNGQNDNRVSVTFLRPDGSKVTVKASQGKSLYDAVIDNNVDIDGFGACEGTLCCTTCHLIFRQSDYQIIGEPGNEELDMLDLAYGLTDTSRLGCQVILKKELDPLEVEVPASINDIREA